MALNIKNERVVTLARDVAERTGQTQTGAIESALERYLADLVREAERDTKRRRIDTLLKEIDATRIEGGPTVAEIMDEMYDPETGLPR
ncbi:type II toxin-antitoxin system VapB family antitoxin [Knoellia subterranea]|uniref:Transcriptional regulator n=1 Tax=Knoellia subterranea KCTC 19937 TaxID=1385521 RepID=A0A0A0JIW6_9MICO|nr:type II toxin-antitoxin system VapB family antitoxin [Knoellia subterranea]KGN37370.1 transcriptional regulator [Knoellia subterranea KCTC 19937]